MRLPLFLLSLCLCAGCSKPTVSARSFYTSRADLASYAIDTPDPEKASKGLGQAIWISWRCPSLDKETMMDVTLRFVNGKERKVSYPIDQRIGWFMVEITPEERKETDGLLSYFIQLRRGDTPLATTQHKLWVEKIEIKE